MRPSTRSCTLLGTLAAVTLSSTAATSMEVIVARSANEVSVYLRMPFDDVQPLFGREAGGLFNDNGTITFDTLSDGTFDDADDLAENVDFEMDDMPVPFEALSMMVHPAATDVPFASPLDALIAVGVCSAELPEGPVPTADMVWIGGWYAFGVEAEQTISITFPKTGRTDRDVTVRDFDGGALVRSDTLSLEDGAPLILAPQRSWFARLFGNG